MPILALDHALDRLETVDAELAKIVELRAFGGLTIEEAAHVLSVSPSTAKRDWRTAKAWLNRELGSGSSTVTDERWPRVKALFQAAVERPTEERDAFLAAATGDDEALRREVESLLTSDTSDASFLDQLPVATDGRGGQAIHVCGRRLEALRPHWAALTVCVRERLPPGSVAVLLNPCTPSPISSARWTHSRIGCSAPSMGSDRVAAAILHTAAKGLTVSDGASISSERLWHYDQIVSDACVAPTKGRNVADDRWMRTPMIWPRVSGPMKLRLILGSPHGVDLRDSVKGWPMTGMASHPISPHLDPAQREDYDQGRVEGVGKVFLLALASDGVLR